MGTLYYNSKTIDVALDVNQGLLYVNHYDKKLYFPRSMKQTDVKSCYNALLIEQDRNCPHKYISDSFSVEEFSTFIDVGAAEGILSLELVDKVKNIFIIESEDVWIEALHATFQPWKDKVNIIKKYASDKDTDTEITLDTILAKTEGNIFIKIDVEGFELKVLHGADKTLKAKDIKIACCTYHKQDDAEIIKDKLIDYGFNTEFTPGYMIFKHDMHLKAPFFRRCIIRGWK